MSNMGHEIVLNDIRTKIRSFLIRMLISFSIGLVTLVVCAIGFGSKNIFTNMLGYWFYLSYFEIKRHLPVFKLSDKDIYNIAINYAAFMHDSAVWKWSFIFAFVVSVLCFVLISYFFIKKGERNALERIMRGNKLISTTDHNRIIKAEYKNKPPFEMGKELKFGKEKILVPESLQYLHFAFIGTSGCGKSTAIEHIISQIQKRQDKAFIVDLNGSFYSKFGRPCDRILSLRDKRTCAWDFWCEKDLAPENIATSMIEASGEQNSFFWKGSRAVLASLIKYSTNNHELWEDFKKSTADIRKKLEDSNEISQRIIGHSENEQADGILGNAVLDFPFLKELNQWNDPNEQKFSITEWINNNNDTSWVYVIVSDKDVEITKPLLRVWFDLACLGCLNREPHNPDNLHTWFIIDELKSMGQMQSLPAILDKGRKYKTSVVLGFQAISQIQKIYGDKDAQSILQGLQNQFYYRMNDDYSANYASTALGEQELEQVNLGMSFGQGQAKDRGSLSKISTKRRVVLPDEIKNLKFLQCYVKLGSHLPCKVHFEILNTKRINALAQSQINTEYIVGKNNPDFKKEAQTESKSEDKKSNIASSDMPWENEVNT